MKASEPSRRGGFDRRLKVRLIALSAAVVLVLAALRATDLADRRRTVLERGSRTARGLAGLLAEHLDETFRTVDVGLREAASFSTGAVGRAASEEEWRAFLDVQRASLRLGSLSVTDADGIIRHSSIPGLLGRSRRDDPLFRRTAADTGDTLTADIPMRALSDPEHTIIPVGRRLTGPDGTFAGAVVATVRGERLQTFFRQIDVGSRGAVWVLLPDGIVLFREPAAGHVPGESAAGSLLFARARAAREPVEWRGPETAGGAEALWATRRVESPALLLAVSLDVDELLADWRAAVQVSLGILGVVVLLLAGGLALIFRQLDARRAAEASESLVRASQRELQTYVDSMSTMSAKVSTDGTILMANRMAQLASGLSAAELVGSDFLSGRWWSFDPEVEARVRHHFARACAGETQNYDERLWAFERTLDVNFSLVPVRGAEGEVEYVVAEGRDITAAKQAQNELSRRTRELESANEELESFSYSVSHDLRAPLRAIAGFVEVLEEEQAPALDDEGRRMLRIIGGNAARMGELIDDLLRFSRLGRVEITVATVDMRALAAAVVEELAPAGLCTVSPSLPTCLGDAAMLRQVWTNLLANALKFSRAAPAPRIEIDGRRTDGEAIYSVRDNGVGFDMAHAANLFGVFERLHDAAEFEGTGVGLAIVKRVVERHGGRVWAEAAVGAGATFNFALPSPPAAG